MEDAHQDHYYLNTLTGDSSWDAPLNWSEVTAQWGQWLLCCTDEGGQLYW